MNILIVALVLLSSLFSGVAWSEESKQETSGSPPTVTEETAKAPELSVRPTTEEGTATAVTEEAAKAPESAASAPTEEGGYAEGFEPYTLGEIVVTGEAVRDIAIVNEVTADQITSTNSRTVPEALTFVPGPLCQDS